MILVDIQHDMIGRVVQLLMQDDVIVNRILMSVPVHGFYKNH